MGQLQHVKERSANNSTVKSNYLVYKMEANKTGMFPRRRVLFLLGCVLLAASRTTTGFVAERSSRVRSVFSASSPTKRRVAADSDNNQGGFDKDDAEKLQRELDLQFGGGGGKKDNLFGVPKKDEIDDYENRVGAVPLFTGTLILLASTAATMYPFYTFFTGTDPLGLIPR